MNSISNNHGENWIKALTFIFLVIIIFYPVFHIASATYSRSFANPFFTENWKFFWIGLKQSVEYKKYVFEFLNPTHKFNFINDKIPTNSLTYSVDFFARILIGYGIFQFIAAFRRHGKKN